MYRSLFLTLVAVMLLGFTSSAMAADEGSWTGWLSDSHCAADHAKSATEDHVACLNMCLKGGAEWALSVEDGAFILEIDGTEAQQFLGHPVVVKGELNPDTQTIKVSSVSLTHEH